MKRVYRIGVVLSTLLVGVATAGERPVLEHAPNTWVKRSPVKGGPISPAMGYETSLGYDPKTGTVIRWGGHNQGGGGEQNAETWAYNVVTGEWKLKEPNLSPPGVCCAQQNVFDPVQGRFLRFASFSGSHGWQWFREIYLNNTAVWNYDLEKNTWRDARSFPAPRVGPLRCASWDSEHQVAVLFGGEGIQEGTVVYDPYTNTWTNRKPKEQPAFRSGGNMAYDEARKLHILFGTQFDNDAHTWAYDMRKNEWRDLKPTLQPPTDRNDPVLAYDAVNRVVVALVRAIDKSDGKEVVDGHLETWIYDAGANTWKRAEPKEEPAGKGNRRRVMIAIPDQNLLLMENYINPTERVTNVEREQQIWTYRHDEAKGAKRLPAPIDVQVKSTKNSAILSWKNSSTLTDSFAVYRGTGSQPWIDFTVVSRLDKDKTSWEDRGVNVGTVNYYMIRGVTVQGTDGLDSVRVRTQPRIVENATVSVMGAGDIRLSWSPSAEEDVVGYRVERAPVEVLSEDEIVRLKKDTAPLKDPALGGIKGIGEFEVLTKELLKEPSFTDKSVDLSKPRSIEKATRYNRQFTDEQVDKEGKPYRYAVFAYRIRAVNAFGVESGPSPCFFTIPSSPQSVFSQEDGETCALKWTANPEKGIVGYRVYRMEGPKVNGPGQPVTRLTDDPIKETTFTDTRATKDTKRYWIVAVDALGQEGIPSAPTWHYRQYRKYYEPFVGEWHQ